MARARPWRRVRPPRNSGKVVPFPFLRPLLPGAPARIAEKKGRAIELKAGNLELRLAENDADIGAIQSLRYQIFYEEMSARPTPEMAMRRQDFDLFDQICDHLMVIDHHPDNGQPRVVGTYRLLRRDAAAELGRFYSQDEFNIRRLMRGGHQILELGRSCVHPAHRKQLTMNLLWRGIAQYVHMHDVRLMFGCASFPGTDPDALAPQLSYLHWNHLAPPAIRPKAIRRRLVRMDRLPLGSFDETAAKNALPPLIRGYLRMGGFVGEGAVIDEQFSTTDVCIIVRTDMLNSAHMRQIAPDLRVPAARTA